MEDKTDATSTSYLIEEEIEDKKSEAIYKD